MPPMSTLHMFSLICICLALTSVAISPEVVSQAALMPFFSNGLPTGLS